MRVIAGEARHLPLKAPKGLDVRPTTDRIKETLFNIISPYVACSGFLDLFSGSGAIGIEALSRGAEFAYLVDNSPASLEVINENLKFTKLADRATVLKDDSIRVIHSLSARKVLFDIIFMDPPYGKGLEADVLRELSQYNILNEEGFIIVEALADTDFSYIDGLGFEMYKEKKYGSNKHVFIRKKEK